MTVLTKKSLSKFSHLSLKTFFRRLHYQRICAYMYLENDNIRGKLDYVVQSIPKKYFWNHSSPNGKKTLGEEYTLGILQIKIPLHMIKAANFQHQLRKILLLF